MRLSRLPVFALALLSLASNSTWAADTPLHSEIAYSMLAPYCSKADLKANPPKSEAQIDQAVQDRKCEYLTQLVGLLRELVKTSLANVNARKTYPSGTYDVKVITHADIERVLLKDEKGRFFKINDDKDYSQWRHSGALDIPAGHKIDFYGNARAAKVVQESYRRIIQLGLERCEKEKSPTKVDNSSGARQRRK